MNSNYLNPNIKNIKISGNFMLKKEERQFIINKDVITFRYSNEDKRDEKQTPLSRGITSKRRVFKLKQTYYHYSPFTALYLYPLPYFPQKGNIGNINSIRICFGIWQFEQKWPE